MTFLFGPQHPARPPQRRPDMAVCSGCSHFRMKQRGASANQMSPKTMVPPVMVESRRECTWFWTQEGRTASRETTLSVYTAGANGGRECPVKRDAVDAAG